VFGASPGRAFSKIYIYGVSKICPTLSETVALRVLNRNFRDFNLFHAVPLDAIQRLMPSVAIVADAKEGQPSLNIC
jgi:hypothetical protein